MVNIEIFFWEQKNGSCRLKEGGKRGDSLVVKFLYYVCDILGFKCL